MVSKPESEKTIARYRVDWATKMWDGPGGWMLRSESMDSLERAKKFATRLRRSAKPKTWDYRSIRVTGPFAHIVPVEFDDGPLAPRKKAGRSR